MTSLLITSPEQVILKNEYPKNRRSQVFNENATAIYYNLVFLIPTTPLSDLSDITVALLHFHTQTLGYRFRTTFCHYFKT